jgi:serine/threonine protein kinase
MSKYCCFFCPAKDYTEKTLDQPCPTCGRSYGFVLTNRPKHIGDFDVTRDLGRGFYGAAYVAERGPFKKKFVLKIAPVEFYTFFSKTSFDEETQLHARLAEAAEHVVGITDRFDEDVIFADEVTVRCHVTVLDFVNGELLRDYIDGSMAASAATICQIAIDLLRIRAEFEANELNHNDLHAENLIVEQLSPQARRQNAIDDSIRVKAIDLGSISDESKSSKDRYGDLLFIATHVDALLDRLLSKPSELDDRDFRAALALQGIVHGLLSDAQNLRQPNPNDLITQIEDAYYRAAQPWRPWSAPLRLKGFADHYNAQTLVSWDVPRLLVDPEGRWLSEVTKPGPQIITGMRGCGKTMLLRALDIHARAAVGETETSKSAIDRIRLDGFVGLFVSAQRLLDIRQSTANLEHRLTRLFVYYSLQAARALLHIRDLDAQLVLPNAHSTLATAVAGYLEGGDVLKNSSSIDDLDRRLERIAVLTSRGSTEFSVKQAPADVFQHLAEQFRSCTTITADSSVFFLLDDVSTRYLELDRIDEILSALLFQSPACAFKFTSEWQTIELGLRSPGRIHPIRVDRDLAVFDLGADVYETINSSGKGKGENFVEKILQQRANFHISHPKYTPRNLLGDVPLEQVAKEIASSSSTSKEKKQAYRGLSCLTSVCVGDIGDVIKLYEEIIKRASTNRSRMTIPISEAIQADCFQAISSRRLYDLNRRGGYYKNHALAFAQAAHDLLTRSYREGVKNNQSIPRLRQYSSIYVRVTTEDQESLKQQIDQLRELIDAGVFVYAGGAPRSKTKDSNPMQQFKLSYRKIYGLAAFIGLADRDRFELSGEDLGEWLGKPDKDILLRNQIKGEVESGVASEGEEVSLSSPVPLQQIEVTNVQTSLFNEGIELETTDESSQPVNIIAKSIDVLISEVSVESLATLPINGVLTGLGFEDRTLASSWLLADHVKSGIVHAVRYDFSERAEAIRSVWEDAGREVSEIAYAKALGALPGIKGLALIDVSGLPKSIIFSLIQRELKEKGQVLVCHMSAEQHYPLQEDLQHLFSVEQADNPIAFLESLGQVLKGEEGPYTDVMLLDEEVDLSRSRALLAFASAKHERLSSLLDKREFDYVEVIAPIGDGPRARVANYAADFVCQNFQNSKVMRVEGQDLGQMVEYLDTRYLDIYSSAGANVELGLTGSKIQAVAAAVLSARRKVAQAWYLSPAKFDETRFSTGVGEARIYEITVGRA